MNNHFSLNGVYIGKAVKRYGLNTGIDKSPITKSLYLFKGGLAGDECADQQHHGGLDRALHQYPIEHYNYWRQKHGETRQWQAPGMGENLSSTGMTENNVCIGDQYQWGEAIIEVSQPRSPCFKLNKRWDIEGLSLEMQNLSLCGWLYRVLQPGFVSIHESLILIHRVDNAMTIGEVCELFFGDPLNEEGLLKLQQQSKLSNSWMSKVSQRLENNTVENWDFRLFGQVDK